MKVAVSLAENVFTPLTTMTLASAIRGRGVVRTGKGNNLVISNDQLNNIIK